MFNFDAYFGGSFGIWGKNKGGWSYSQEKSRKADTLCLVEFLDGSFNLAKFHSNWRDSIITPAWSSGGLSLNLQ